MRLSSPRLVTAALLGLAAAASATTLVALDVPGLTRLSDAVVRGTVTSVEAKWSGDKARIFTHATVKVTEVLLGNASGTVTVIQPGGELDGIGQVVHGVATFKAGDDVVVFLERRGPFFTVTGMQQGAFGLSRGADGALVATPQLEATAHLVDRATQKPAAALLQAQPYATLKAQVRASLPAQPVEPTSRPGVKPE